MGRKNKCPVGKPTKNDDVYSVRGTAFLMALSHREDGKQFAENT
jgi:hypothetical protein